MTESDAKAPKLSSEWWKAKKPKSIPDAKLESALKAYESMAKANEWKNQVTQLGILLTTVDEVKKLCKPDKDKEHKYVLQAMENYVLEIKKEKSLVDAKLLKDKEARQKAEKGLDAFVEKTWQVVNALCSKLNKNYQLLNMVLEKKMSLKFSQIDATVSPVFDYERDMKKAMDDYANWARAWVGVYAACNGETPKSATERWQAQPKAKEIVKLKQEFDEQVKWVRNNAQKVRGECGVAG